MLPKEMHILLQHFGVFALLPAFNLTTTSMLTFLLSRTTGGFLVQLHPVPQATSTDHMHAQVLICTPLSPLQAWLAIVHQLRAGHADCNLANVCQSCRTAAMVTRSEAGTPASPQQRTTSDVVPAPSPPLPALQDSGGHRGDHPAPQPQPPPQQGREGAHPEGVPGPGEDHLVRASSVCLQGIPLC